MKADRLLRDYEQISDAPEAIARLRRFVLDLAVRGRLVPQDGNDEPASELLKHIAAEWDRLAKAGDTRKRKPLPAVDDPPFFLPRCWEWTRIREVASDRGQMIPQAAFTYIDVTAIDKEAGVVANPKVLEANAAPSRARKIARKGDVIYSCVRPYLLNVAVIETEFDPPPIASTAFAVLNGHGLVLPRYFWVVLRSPFMVERVEESQRGQAYPAINDADFAVLPFPLPPLAEQHRIVAKVDELMALCDQLEAARGEREATRDKLTASSLARLNAPHPQTFQDDARFALGALPALTARPDQIKRLRQTILNLAVHGKLVAQDPSDEPAADLLKRIAKEKARLIREGNFNSANEKLAPNSGSNAFSIPLNWSWCYLDDIAVVARGGSPRPIQAFLTDDPKGIPWIKIGDSTRGSIYIEQTKERIKPSGLAKSRLVIPGDLLLSNSMSFGFPYITKVKGCIHDGWLLIRTPERLVDKLYLHKILLSDSTKSAFADAASGAVVQNLNADKARRLALPLAPLAEQHRIVAKIDELMALCDGLEASLNASNTARQRLLEALLAEALTAGELEPEPAK